MLPVLLSHHHGMVSELSAAHAAYGPTVRLAKRWLGAHMLLGGQVGVLCCGVLCCAALFFLVLGL